MQICHAVRRSMRWWEVQRRMDEGPGKKRVDVEVFLNRPITWKIKGYGFDEPKFEAPEGETLLYSEHVAFKKQEAPFGVAVTERAVYVLKRRLMVFFPLWKYRRFALHEIREIEIKPISRKMVWAFSIFFYALGFIGMMGEMAVFRRGGTFYSPEFLFHGALIAVAIIIPLILRGRRGLTIRSTKGALYWVPPISARGKAARKADAALRELATVCTSLGIRVVATGDFQLNG